MTLVELLSHLRMHSYGTESKQRLHEVPKQDFGFVEHTPYNQDNYSLEEAQRPKEKSSSQAFLAIVWVIGSFGCKSYRKLVDGLAQCKPLGIPLTTLL